MAGAKAIKRILKAMGITQQELADRLGLPLQTVHNQLHRDTFSLNQLIKYCEALGVQIVAIVPSGDEYKVE